MKGFWRLDQTKHTLSGQQNLLSIARQPQPRWSLSVRKHLHPMHELLTTVEKKKDTFTNPYEAYEFRSEALLTECRRASLCLCVHPPLRPVWIRCRNFPLWRCGPGRWWAAAGQTHCRCDPHRWTEPSGSSELPRVSCPVRCSDDPVRLCANVKITKDIKQTF